MHHHHQHQHQEHPEHELVQVGQVAEQRDVVQDDDVERGHGQQQRDGGADAVCAVRPEGDGRQDHLQRQAGREAVTRYKDFYQLDNLINVTRKKIGRINLVTTPSPIDFKRLVGSNVMSCVCVVLSVCVCVCVVVCTLTGERQVVDRVAEVAGRVVDITRRQCLIRSPNRILKPRLRTVKIAIVRNWVSVVLQSECRVGVCERSITHFHKLTI